VLIEPEGEPKKILRVTLPLGMQLIHGTRVIIDQSQPMTAPYVICFTNGCMADYEATAQMVDQMKKGKGLVVQAINANGQPISLVLPLADFAKAYDGPPTDPKVFEAQQEQLQQQLQKRAEEARKKLEQTQPGPGASATPPNKTQ
jgi:Invasion associated locus B (IalB) protein